MKNVMTAVIAGLLLAAALTGCNVRKDVYSSSLSEGHKDARYEYGPGYARYNDPDVSLELKYLNPAGVDLYFSKYKGGAYPNPIPARSYMVFSLSILNNSKKYVEFNPRMSSFVDEDSAPSTPKDYSGLYSDLSIAGAENVDERMHSFRAACYDTSEKLAPGQSVHKLLVYQRPEDMKGGGLVMINGLYVGYEIRQVTLQYDEDLGLPEEE